jgi:hypothetical protein
MLGAAGHITLTPANQLLVIIIIIKDRPVQTSFSAAAAPDF